MQLNAIVCAIVASQRNSSEDFLRMAEVGFEKEPLENGHICFEKDASRHHQRNLSEESLENYRVGLEKVASQQPLQVRYRYYTCYYSRGETLCLNDNK
mmetsp:Transcript_20737/g.31449  ORF Transcript_20737/g.31449 Transcript_20737/m.31449 type:complete len:98 (-) Transcript_20737:20-313(-)